MPSHDPDDFIPSFLTLGWKRDGDHPEHFSRSGSFGAHDPEKHLVRLAATKLKAYSAIIAQSGAGKSFLLGRLVEEILLKTKGRCLILDPNADFGRIGIVNERIWAEPYNPAKRTGYCPTEVSAREFQDRWRRIPQLVLSARPRSGQEPLTISWVSVPPEALSTNLESPLQQLELRRCHEVYRAVAKLKSWKQIKPVSFADVRLDALNVLGRGGADAARAFASQYSEEKTIEKIPPSIVAKARVEVIHYYKIIDDAMKRRARYAQPANSAMQVQAEAALEYYESLVDRLAPSGIHVGDYLPSLLNHPEISPEPRLLSIQLPSIRDRGTRLLAVSAILSREWSKAQSRWEGALGYDDEKKDLRVPTYIVIDEAHHLMPSGQVDIATGAVREQLRTIAGEGRKFGLFLVVVSQRPDKLDERILSECRNVILLRMSSSDVLQQVASVLGLDGDPELRTSLDFRQKGLALLAGDWSPSGDGLGRTMFVAARRTVQGGRDLQDYAWASPYDELQGAENA